MSKVTKKGKKMNVAKILKKARLELDVSQKHVGDFLGLKSHQYISNIERGVSKPSADILNKLRAIYGGKVDKIAKHLANEKKKEFLEKAGCQ